MKYLLPEITSKNLLPDYQTGFRAHHSCVDAAAVLRDQIVHARSRKEHTAVCLLDISKAFDSVWIDGLIWKLADFGINSSVCTLLASFLSDREATVAIGEHLSPTFPVKRGVPQGTVLGPHLYNLFVSDQPSTAGASLLQYADDTAIIASDRVKQSLQTQVTALEDFYAKWGISVNSSK